jgi:hypothetical protein
MSDFINRGLRSAGLPDVRIEATNNESERALRPSVIFRRVRTDSARNEAPLRRPYSVVATGRLAGRTGPAVIRDVLAAPAPKPTAVPSGG